MPKRRPRRPAEILSLATPQVADETTNRALLEITQAVREIQSSAGSSEVLVTDLRAGVNKLNHGLGRRPSFVSVMPTAISAAFAWAFVEDGNPHPERQLWIETVGATQIGAKVLVM